jgi:hypothetical protein
VSQLLALSIAVIVSLFLSTFISVVMIKLTLLPASSSSTGFVMSAPDGFDF